MLGDLVGEFNGKTTVLRILSEGKFESTDQMTGKILGVDASAVSTGVLTPMPNGVFMGEGNGLITTADGGNIMLKASGIGWSTGKGEQAAYRGVIYFLAQSEKLMSLNKTVGVYEYDIAENGGIHLKIWAWK